MRFLTIVLLALAIIVPQAAHAEEIIEEDVGVIIEESDATEGSGLAYERSKSGYGEKAASEPAESAPPVERKSERIYLRGREGRFRVGLVGPGYAWANRGAGSMMNIGPEGEYFFWENLSAGMRIWVASDFADITIVSFLPFARYVFDFASHPRWSVYVQAGVGLALYQGEHAAADIAIPGGGFWWQWTDRWSVGADASLHVLARSSTAVGFTISPAIRYQF